jgi:hypothetical protein
VGGSHICIQGSKVGRLLMKMPNRALLSDVDGLRNSPYMPKMFSIIYWKMALWILVPPAFTLCTALFCASVYTHFT